MANRLAHSLSPYLLQHADNPVDWWEWGDDAFAEAERRDVPILLSVGYAACHWCHVMAHESFEDEQVAAAVNGRFVAVKVDREERPDVDAVYMSATTALTGHGGWPMTCLLTPSGDPFFAGTYLPRAQFLQLLDGAAHAWETDRERVLSSGATVAERLRELTGPPAPTVIDPDVCDTAVRRLRSTYDEARGGFGGAPKFPPSMVLEFLLRHHARTGSADALAMVTGTAHAMARGGLYDQLGGGFARYSVDADWVVPHFEKMLYDNALLLGSYVRGWRRVPDHDPALRGLLERTVRGIVGWLERDLLLPGGGFAASLDADSADDRGMQHEGIHYVWSPDLLRAALGEADGEWAAGVFHVTNAGTFEHGLSTLQLRGNPDPVRLRDTCERLLGVRSRRFAPARDDKLVAAWNGFAIDSLVWAATVFDEPGWLRLAAGAAAALWDLHCVDGRLRRTSLAGVAGEAPGAAEDYGAVALGFARLAGALGDATWLRRAEALLEVALALFAAPDGGFFDAASDAEPLFARPRDVQDNPTPSGTMCLVAALRLVALLADRPEWGERADAAALTTHGLLAAAPRFAGAALVDAVIAYEARTGLRPAVAVVVADDPLSELARATWRMAPVGTAVLVGPAGTTGFAHHFESREPDLAYVCRGTTCFAPAADVAGLRAALWSRA